MSRTTADASQESKTVGIKHLMLASEGRPIPDAAIKLTTDLALRNRAKVTVFSIVRIWGTSLGLPNPGLLPTRREWDAQRAHVAAAVTALRQNNVDAEGHIVGTRNPGKRIIDEAKRLECDAIVMAAEAPRHWLIASLLWSQEAYRIRKRADLPVYIVPVC